MFYTEEWNGKWRTLKGYDERAYWAREKKKGVSNKYIYTSFIRLPYSGYWFPIKGC